MPSAVAAACLTSCLRSERSFISGSTAEGSPIWPSAIAAFLLSHFSPDAREAIRGCTALASLSFPSDSAAIQTDNRVPECFYERRDRFWVTDFTEEICSFFPVKLVPAFKQADERIYVTDVFFHFFRNVFCPYPASGCPSCVSVSGSVFSSNPAILPYGAIIPDPGQTS